MAGETKTRNAGAESRLRHEVGMFRERFQALSTILQDLQGQRSPQSILRSAQAVIASTTGADAVWIIDGRSMPPRALLRSQETLPPQAVAALKPCMRSGRMAAVQLDDRVVHLIPLMSGPNRWGALAVRVSARNPLNAEVLRFLFITATLLGGATALWENRAPAGFDVDAVQRGWLSLSALPARCLMITGEVGSGKRTLAERLHDRYAGGSFAAAVCTGSEEDEAAVAAALKRPGLRTLYVSDAVKASPAARALVWKQLEAGLESNIFLSSAEPIAPIYPDALLSRAALVTIRLPALRERSSEVPGMVQAGVSERGLKLRLSSSAKQLLQRHAWPGNYRELSKFVAQAEQALRLEGSTNLTGQLTRRLLGEAPWISLPNLVDGLESQVLSEALRRFEGNHAAVARALGMTPRQVAYKCEKYGLE